MNVSLEPDRVRRSTAPNVNREIDEMIRETVQRYASQPETIISQRIGVLDREWDIERVLEANAATVAFAGILSAASGHRRGLVLSGAVLVFLLTHAFKGWCPPLPVLRRLGVRTRREIERERFVLKYLRGDFDGVSIEQARQSPEELLEAVAR
jgi:hypothetical protein